MAESGGPSAAAIKAALFANSSDGGSLPVTPAGGFPGRSTSMMGEQITVSPRPLQVGIWTYGIPATLWRTGNDSGGDGTVSSVDGSLTLTGGTVDGGITWIESRDHPRYEVDAPFGFVTATPSLPIGSNTKVRFGQFTAKEGVYIEIDCAGSGTVTLKTRRTTGVTAPSPEDHTDGGGTTNDTTAATATVPTGSDISNATLWDIYSQWRGVGDQKMLIDLQQAAISDRIGSATDLWASNPALPMRIEVERVSTSDESVSFGCARIVSHAVIGADEYDRIDIVSGNVTVDNTERPVLVLQAAGFLGGMACTRDHIVSKIRGATIDAAGTVRVRRNATISNANVTWSIPDDARGLVKGVGSATATVTNGDLLYSRPIASGEVLDIEALVHKLRPIPATLTTGANRGDPAYGETWTITFQKATGGTATASATVQVGSLY